MKNPYTRLLLVAIAAAILTCGAHADGLLYQYEGDVFPFDPSAGWSGDADTCSGTCDEFLENGHFVLTWTGGAAIVGYGLNIAVAGDTQPPTLWAEWGERSNNLFDGIFFGCDGQVNVWFREVRESVAMHGDAAFSFEGGSFILGLDPSVFHTYRFESADGLAFRFSVDGQVFFQGTGVSAVVRSLLAIAGFGSCSIDEVNEWDFVRYGTIGGGEQMVSVDPPSGTLTASEGAQLRSFIITFDQPAYLYINDITVSATGGTAPTILATRRLDNGPPEVLEVFIQDALPPGQTTTFTFDTGTGPQEVSYMRIQPEIPATSGWSLLVMLILMLLVGAAVFRKQAYTYRTHLA